MELHNRSVGRLEFILHWLARILIAQSCQKASRRDRANHDLKNAAYCAFLRRFPVDARITENYLNKSQKAECSYWVLSQLPLCSPNMILARVKRGLYPSLHACIFPRAIVALGLLPLSFAEFHTIRRFVQLG